MADTNVVADVAVGGGKHAALWERMRAQKLGGRRCQMIHRRKVPETQPECEISMQVTMSPEQSSTTVEHEEESPLVVVVGRGAMELSDENHHKNTADANEPATLLLGTSFVSSSSTVENAIQESEDTVSLLATSAPPNTTIKTSPSSSIRPEIHVPNGFTPAVLYKNWNPPPPQQQQDDDVLEQRSILMMMMSDDSSVVHAPNENHAIPIATSPSCDFLSSSSSSSTSPTSPLTAMRSNSVHQALEETSHYVTRIQQLQHDLLLLQAQQQQQTRGGQEQPHPPPSSSSALLERNKTLIKEVRFAEQTCVELSQQNEALQQRAEGLARQLQRAKREKQGLDDRLLVSHRTCATLQSEKAALTRALQEERRKRMLLQQQQTATTTTIVKENVEPNHDYDSGTSLSTHLEPNRDSESDHHHKLVVVEHPLEARHELHRAPRHFRSSSNDDDEECNVSHATSNTELELAKSHAKVAQEVSQELPVMLRDEATNGEESNNHNHHHNITVNDSTVERLQVTVERLTRECRHRDAAAVEATNQIRALEYELSLAKRQIVVERETLQREFLIMTQSTVANVQRQSELLEDQVSKRTEQFQSRIATLTRYVQHLQDSLDFESEAGSTRGSRLEEQATADDGSSDDSDRDKMDEGSSEGAVMNATFHPSQSATRSIHEEMLLEQMEEARLVDDAQADTHHLVGHEMFEDLSFISDLSHLYEDLSGLLMHDPTSPILKANANVKISTLAAKSTTVDDASPTRKPVMQIRLESIKQDFMKLKTIVDCVESMAAANGSHVHLNGAIEGQARVVESLERKLGDLVDEAGKNDAERRQLNLAVLEMSKEFNRCQAELKESTAALEKTKKAEADAKLDIQMTLVKLEATERAISVLEDEKERLSLALQQLSESSNHLLQKQKEEKVHQNALAAATEHVEKLQQKVESKSRQLDDSKRQSNDLLSKVETLESNIGKLTEEKSQIQAKYDDASSLLRALSREREQHKQEIDSAKASVLERGRELKVAAETMSAQKEELQKLLTEREAAVDKSDKLSKTVEELTTERNELSSEIQQLKNSVATAKSELEYLKVSYITCNDRLADVSEKNAGKDELVAKIKSSNRAAKEAIATYEQRLSTLNTELETTQSKRSVLQQQLTAMEKDLRATAADFVSYKNAMESKLSEQQELVEQVQSTAEALKCTYEHKLSSLSMEHETMMDEVNQTINSLMRECRAAYVDSLGFLSQIGYEFDVGEPQLLGSRELPWKQSLKAISSHLPKWKQIVQECTHVIDDYQDRLHQAVETIGDLANNAAALKDSEAKMEDKLLVQQHHSQTLADKLSTAKMELTKSMREAAEMSQTFALTKRELEHVSKQLANQNDLKERTKELISDRQEAEVRVAEMKRAITSLEERLKAAVGES
jgi:predicted  nucleic acid-binding Zn-ribbon protein/uncharacterized protein YbaR (Trm112 family)